MLSFRTFPSWAAAFAFLFQVLVPFGQSFPSFATTEPLVICTQLGPRVINLGDTPADQQQQQADRSTCAVCISLDTARLSAPVRQFDGLIYVVSQSLTYSVEYLPMVSTAHEKQSRPRAPPASA